MRVFAAAFLLAASLAVSPEAGVEATLAEDLSGAQHPPPAGWRLAFRAEFGAGSLSSRWGRCHWWDDQGCTIASNHELQWYRRGNATVGRGRLRLEAREEAFTSPGGTDYDYTSGMVSSGPRRWREPARYAFTYGYVEARVRLPAGRGLWPAFWLLPADSESLPEIDVVETLGHETEEANFHYHYRDGQGEYRVLGSDWTAADLADGGWHRFAVDWRRGSITWVVDGRERWRVTGPRVSREPMYLVANLAVGGDYPGPPDDATVFPAAFEVDWVRVWQPR